MDNATRTALSAALEPATVEQLREDAADLCESVESFDEDTAARLRRMAALALAVAEMQERSVNAIPQDPTRPHVIFWGVDPNVGMADWIAGDVGDNAERSLPAALASLLRGGA